MDKRTIYKLADDWNLHKEELKEKKFYLFNVKDGDIIKLNEVSFDILRNMNGEKSLEEIVKTMREMYNVDENILWNDILMLITKCMKKNVLTSL